MARLATWLGLTALVAVAGCDVAPVWANTAQGRESEAAMSEDVRRMHERLMALSKGEGSMSDLRIEFFDGGGMSSFRSFSIEAGHLTTKEFESPGSPMIQRKGSVTDSRVSELLQGLIEREYWTFQGTRFIPDAPMFLFRFYYAGLSSVDFRCDAEEFQESESRAAIRNLFLTFASETEMTIVPDKP